MVRGLVGGPLVSRMADYRQYRVWQVSHALVRDLYDTLVRFPPQEQYALVAQIRRAVISIPTNIAEALGRSGDGQRAYLIDVARGSAAEVDYQLLLSRDLGYISQERFDELVRQLTRVRKMLSGLHRRMREGQRRTGRR